MSNTAIISKIRALFVAGGKYSAKELNALAGTNDARKNISILRQEEGMNICDLRLPNRCKLYFYVDNSNQLKLEL